MSDAEKDLLTNQPTEDASIETEEAVATDVDAMIESMQKEIADVNDKLLRTAAEYDNFRKRSQREKEALIFDITAAVVAGFLPCLDNIERALAVDETAAAADIRKGVDMVYAQMMEAFKTFGIEAIGEAGQAFSPEQHHAVGHVDDADMGENVVAAVLQKGYKIGEKVIRPAMVQVAN